MSDLHIFWDEEKQRSELHWQGFVLYGQDKDAAAIMGEMARLIQASAELRLWIGEIDKTVTQAVRRAIAK